MLSPADFNSAYNYLPFKSSKEAAIQAALVIAQPNAAVGDSTWYVLEMDMPANFVYTGSSLLTWPQTDTHRFFGDIVLEDWRWNWNVVKVSPAGIEAWADAKLTRCSTKKEAGHSVCMGCRRGDKTTWGSCKFFNNEDYCAECWFAFYNEHEKA